MNWGLDRTPRGIGAQGLLAECGLFFSWGGDMDSKHSPRDKLEVEILGAPNRKAGSWLSELARLGMELVVNPFIRLRDGRRGAAILRLVRTFSICRGAGTKVEQNLLS